MIPKKIHYFWFGRGQKSELETKCIERFRIYAPEAEIIEWNEDNFDVSAHPYTKAACAEKKWAFVSDYARLKVLSEEGGIYLDTDMWLVRDISELFEENSFIGKEDEVYISAGIIGASAGDQFIGDVLQKYDTLQTRTAIPRVLTEVYTSKNYETKTYSPEYFYPFTADNIRMFDIENPPEKAFAVHMWNYSWGNPIIKFSKKIGIHRQLIRLTELMGIKNTLKKILKSE
jgi:mannosyltransferase OCH1-like enzyme